jgi:hypothetical protein
MPSANLSKRTLAPPTVSEPFQKNSGTTHHPPGSLDARCLRFAVRIAPTPRKTHFRPVANLCRAGRDPQGLLRLVSADHLLWLSPFPGFSWRDGTTPSRGGHEPRAHVYFHKYCCGRARDGRVPSPRGTQGWEKAVEKESAVEYFRRRHCPKDWHPSPVFVHSPSHERWNVCLDGSPPILRSLNPFYGFSFRPFESRLGRVSG